MSKILLGLSILLMAAAAVLGFMTQGKVKALNSDVAAKQQQLSSQESSISKAKADLKAASDQLASTKAEMDGMNTQASASKAALDSANASVAAANAKVADLEKQLEDKKNAPPAPPVDNTAQLADLQKSLADTQSALKEAQQVRDSMQERANKLDADMVSLRTDKERREKGMAAVGLQGQVLAVNQAWSFVVLSIGDRQGVVANVEMLVTRGGEQIGKVKVSSVEPGSAVADIVPGSLKSGVTVQPGDTVIYKGS